MLASQPRGCYKGDKKLTAVAIRTKADESHPSRHIKLVFRRNLIGNGHASGGIAVFSCVRGIAALDGISFDNAMEKKTIVKSFAHEAQEIITSSGSNIREKENLYFAVRGFHQDDGGFFPGKTRTGEKYEK